MNGMRAVWIRVAAVLTAALLAFALLPGVGQAQITTEQREFFQEWLDTAERAEEAVEAGRASNIALELLRAQIVEYRDRFETARTQNSARIETLQSQLNALGPPPEDGQTEPEEIATLRADLNNRIDTLRVPVVVSFEAYNRADGIITEIDRIIRERQRQELLRRTDTPLDPQLWLPAWRAIIDASKDLHTEARVNWANQTEMQRVRQSLPQAGLYLAFGLLFLFRGRRWAEQAGAFMRRFGGVGSGAWRFLISLGRIGLPLVGVYLIIESITVSGVLGLRGELVLGSLPYWATLILGFQWLAERLYPRRPEDLAFNVQMASRPAARRNVLSLGLILVLHDMVNLLDQIEHMSYSVRGVIGFPVILLGAAVVMRMRQIAMRDELARKADGDEDSRRTGLMWIGPLFRWSAGIVALSTPLIAAAGYGAMAEAILFPYMITVGLYGALLVLQVFFRDIYAWMTGRDAEAADASVIPILIGFALVLGSLPFLALIWGARQADLTEVWDQFLQGVQVGDSRISPVDFLTFAVVFVLGYMLTRIFQNALKSSLLPRTKLDQGGQTAIVSGTGYVGIFLAALIAVSTAGIDLSSLAIVAGALSVGIGFGLQNIVSNFVSGIILLIERPVAEGDWIEVNGNMGYVRDISVRSTRIETFDRSDVIVPNADLVSGTVTNYTRGNTIGRLILPIGVAYGTDTKLVEGILREIAEAHPMVLANPAPFIVFKEFGADSLNFEIRAILRDVNWTLSVKSEMNHQINARFAEEGIEIPFAQRDLWLRNPETLSPKPAAGPVSEDAGRPVPKELQMPGDDGEGPADDH
ncbi:MAG: DUF3772 domain-containing protein [Paracoccaceae bacterium]